MSSHFQDLICYVGAMDTYDKGANFLNRFFGIEMNEMMINKVTSYYGEVVKKEDELLQPTIAEIKGEDYLYIGIDGSMLLTRESGWKEVKLCRMFKGSDSLKLSQKRGWIKDSQYYATLGNKNNFTEDIENLIDRYKQNFGIKNEKIIFLSDGAKWIKNWVEDAYQGSKHILDIYHVQTYLNTFYEFNKKALNEDKKWVEIQKEKLEGSRVEEVIKEMEIIATNAQQPDNEKIINYFKDNIKRMDYLNYKKIGTGIIGSGAVESAHRTLLQSRMKRSGQRWTIKGLNNMIKLKTIQFNNKWAENVTRNTQKPNLLKNVA